MENKFSLNTTYSSFDDTIGKSAVKSTCTFFENEFQMSLASIIDFTDLKKAALLAGELFYTCQISIKNKQHVTLRVTSDFIRIIFHDMFGSSAPVFNLEKLTELEKMILNSYFEFIVKNLSDFLIKDTDSAKIDPLNKTNLNFIFLIKNKDVNCGKLSIEIPLNRLNIKPIDIKENFTFDSFINNFAYVDLIAGCAKISLSDLKNLDKDDILVLEKSNIKIMRLKTPTVECEFKVNPEPSIMLDLGENSEEFDENIRNYEVETMPDKTMWDDIQIEVTAEFKKVKMTLGELKQISKGLVIDLGPVMNNEISLLVENKAVAKGELVIINDKYGVKITNVFASKKEEEAPKGNPVEQPIPQKSSAPSNKQSSAQNPPPIPPNRPIPPRPQGPAQQGAKPAAKQAPPPMQPRPQAGAKQAPQGKKEDFDYSNFEE